MILLDTALRKRQETGRPVRVGLIGAGYMGRGIALQIITATCGMELVAIANRNLSEARQSYVQAGVKNCRTTDTVQQINVNASQGIASITEDPSLLCRSELIDVLIEVTGTIEYAAGVVLEAIEHGKHLVLMNAELDATLGPLLKMKADQAGVVISNSDGDQPGVIMNLYRYVQTIGCRPVLAGNIKGLQDPYRTPETQKGYAEKYRQNPKMVTAFADGTKISMEMAVVANATGFKAGRRGMYGPQCKHVNKALDHFSKDQMLRGGIVDYLLGAEPAPGVFIIGYNDHPLQRQYLNYYKMGDGPFYVFYTPYHLCHFEAPLTAARVVLFHDAAVAPLGAPVCDVITLAKKDLKKGEILDGIGGFSTYGMIENSSTCIADKLLPMGISEGCRVKQDIGKDTALTYSHVELPPNRLMDRLRAEQTEYFGRNYNL